MARDVRQLREDAAAAAGAGKYKRALEAYIELERQEPSDAQWPKRAAEMLRRLGKTKEAIAAYDRAVDRYTSGGFLVQAIAVCKLILQLDPTHQNTQRRLSAINELQGNASTRIGALAEGNTSLHDNPAVAPLRAGTGTTRPPALGGSSDTGSNPAIPRTRTRASQQIPPLGNPATPGDPSTALGAGLGVRFKPPTPPLAAGSAGAPGMPPLPEPPRTRTGDEITMTRSQQRSRTSTPPFKLDPGAPIEQVVLADILPGVHQHRVGTLDRISVIPLDETLDDDIDRAIAGHDTETMDEATLAAVRMDSATGESGRAPSVIESVPVWVDSTGDTTNKSLDIDPSEIDEPEELQIDDLEEVPLAAPRMIGSASQRALARTPLFAGLPMATLQALIEHLQLIALMAGEVLFREGDPGDALFIISEGEIAVSSEGPPRVELSRLGPGAFFGEVSLVTDQPRAATATATAPTELMMIDRRAMGAVLARAPDALRPVLRFVRDRLVDRLVRTSPLFRPFDEPERRELANRFRFLEIDPGALILPAGERSDGLYIVLAGRVEVQRDGGGRVVLGPGDMIGETSLLTGERVASPVVAVGKCLALCLPAAQFRELIMTHPHVLEYVGQQVEARRKVRML